MVTYNPHLTKHTNTHTTPNRPTQKPGNKVYLDKAVDAYWDCCSRYQQGDAAYRALSWADMTAGAFLVVMVVCGFASTSSSCP